MSNAGAPIPRPEISLIEASRAATDHLKTDESRLVDAEIAPASEYFLMSAQYTNQLANSEDWAWEVKFIHPVLNDHVVVYKVSASGDVEFLYVTE